MPTADDLTDLQKSEQHAECCETWGTGCPDNDGGPHVCRNTDERHGGRHTCSCGEVKKKENLL